ncbi:interaptin-like isoform X1 [Leguminivora glycinivorella]|uniref:interaptin-like isoform X1 n=1 Tax=Leguminivora glycinivorella TaxID=1035111 RepID=UPI00200F5AFD|nr:interaptin-like isoform X1 [Leguminivora glycinivorella]
MDLDRDTSNTDECLETALQIFDFCGAKSTGTLHVGALMDKFAPSVKTNNAEFSYLKTLLDPNQSNPEISVPQLASALNAFTDSQKTKLDLDESFNLKSGMGPQDSDSGISNDGYVILEELQAELREKTHLATKLRGQLDFADRQHEEALAALSAERDSLRSHLNMLREENMTLTHERRDYEEACERLCSSEQALALAKRERDTAQRRATTALEQAATLEAEKLTLQELLSKSKEECHRINEMYASRQASLLEQNELLKRERAELATRLQDQEDLVQQMLKEKVILEMELKDVLNRSNQTQLRLDRSIDVSYTEDQMLTALDSLNVDSRFSPDNHVLEEEAFIKALKDQELGRASNLSLFDEIRLSFCNITRTPDASGNVSKSQLFEFNDSNNLDTSNTGTQTDELKEITNNNECDCTKTCFQCEKLQNDLVNVQNDLKTANNNVSLMQTELIECEKDFKELQKRLDIKIDKMTSETQTDDPICSNCKEKTIECNNLKDSRAKLRIDLKKTQHKGSNTEKELIKAQLSLKTLQNYIDNLKVDLCDVGTQINYSDVPLQIVTLDNNNIEACDDCTKQCLNCDKLQEYTAKLEYDIAQANTNVANMQLDLDTYENTLNGLQNYLDEGVNRNDFLETMSQNLQAKLEVLETACIAQKEKIESMTCEMSCIESQTDYDVASVGTQAEVPCAACETRTAVAPQRSIRRLLWESLKCLFQAFAVLCFIFALSSLYGVTRRRGCGERELPWRWLDAQEFMDLLLRIEYVADVPM